MKFLKVVGEAAGPLRPWLLLASLVSALGSISVLATINYAIESGKAEGDAVNTTGLLLFVLAACGVLGGLVAGQRIADRVVEGLLDRSRVRIATTLRRLDYDELEAIGSQWVYDGLTRNSAILSEAAKLAVPAVTSVGALVLGGFYTLLLSPLVFAVIAILLVLSVFYYRLSQRQTHGSMGDASKVQGRFYILLRHLLEGFKEVRLHRPRGEDLGGGHLVPASVELREAQIAAAVQVTQGVSVSYVFFYLMLGSLAFVLPPFLEDELIVVQSIYVAIYMLGIVETILRAAPLLTRAGFALGELEAVERRLEATARAERPPSGKVDFERLSGIDLLYSYRQSDGATAFAMGPMTLELSKGELLFIVGGNGSGKSTLLKTFTRLYQPESGVLLWDGVPVEAANARAYRSLFSAVFSDFHLFDRLYGLEGVPAARVNALLQDLGIGHKTAYRDGRFTRTDLSTGQRKRLALAVALLEERPILVLDELAADQDPEFRRHFYDTLLPRWKAEGRTMIVVSHDDRYFALADRTLVLANGHANLPAPA